MMVKNIFFLYFLHSCKKCGMIWYVGLLGSYNSGLEHVVSNHLVTLLTPSFKILKAGQIILQSR